MGFGVHSEDADVALVSPDHEALQPGLPAWLV